MKCDLLIIDGRNLLWRSTDAYSTLCATVGEKEIGTGGMYGFLTMLIRICQKHQSKKVAIAWEGKRNFRHAIYPDYKKRTITQEQILLREEVMEQEKRLKAILRVVGVRQYVGINCEADDVMGRLSKATRALDMFCVIYTADSDLRQLVDSHTFVVSPGFRNGEIVYDEKAVEEKHGVAPSKIAELKALAGDNSDNIPGIRGIGDKTAAKLLNEFGSLKDVISAAEGEGYWAEVFWPVHMKHKQAIKDEKEKLFNYKKLTTIDLNAKIKPIKPKRDQALVLKHLRAYRFKSLMVPVELRQLMEIGVKSG